MFLLYSWCSLLGVPIFSPFRIQPQMGSFIPEVDRVELFQEMSAPAVSAVGSASSFRAVLWTP